MYEYLLLGTAFSGPTEEITRKWVYDAYEHWDQIRKTVDASEAGVTQISGYIFSSTTSSVTRVSNVLSYLFSSSNNWAFVESTDRGNFTDLSRCD